MKLARSVRDNELDVNSAFHQSFYRSPKLNLWQKQRLISQNVFAAICWLVSVRSGLAVAFARS